MSGWWVAWLGWLVGMAWLAGLWLGGGWLGWPANGPRKLPGTSTRQLNHGKIHGFFIAWQLNHDQIHGFFIAWQLNHDKYTVFLLPGS